MQYRVFGRTGWRVSAIGLGCWQLGGQWGEMAEADGIATVHAAIEAGINLFDSADSYGPRRSEEVLGKALAGARRPHVFVATKVGNLARPDGHSFSYTTPEHIYACCDASLHRLQTDYI
ncbi:MAG: aldo/keto reductase, partial [Chloroflexota bacterium]|nr:aldo/keto reductase [Chloroflexota bacterium]